MNQNVLAIVEWIIMAAALYLLFPALGWGGLVGLFLAFVGFEMHLIWHRRDRETKAARKKSIEN
ncbi:MAG: hypothetical protein PHT37_05795 [Candidatus Cloacimonetes bacterium]|jgi:hypothetical protein|nr:hypothetical protein [Candidatus Cloacimonadota bacterium]MDD2423794.1 hypothetical protein [Candidatus Cloacimonadota bacterium]MDD3562708.1 hypothetical protein [Candidatus Cloacimonadota bacterium]MDD4277381.1 hypothetical protein [Candidatus Cloacimonadota bacterium]MDY0324770.1 hypothetical protein [Candidatus Cloacimonadaceae bacterium]